MQGVIYQYNINEKLYIGKTYVQQRKRMDKHKYDALTLRRDTPFCRAIRKYGWERVEAGYSVIETLEAEDKHTLNSLLIERESYWIEYKNSLVPNGYNVYSKGQENVPHTYNKEEIYKRVSNSLKGKYMNHPSTSKPIYCVEQDKWYPSISEAERQNGIANGSIQKAASGKNVTAEGLRWSYDGTVSNRIDGTKAKRKPVYCIETGQTYISTYEAAIQLLNDRSQKCRIQASLKHGWAVNGLHFAYLTSKSSAIVQAVV